MRGVDFHLLDGVENQRSQIGMDAVVKLIHNVIVLMSMILKRLRIFINCDGVGIFRTITSDHDIYAVKNIFII